MELRALGCNCNDYLTIRCVSEEAAEALWPSQSCQICPTRLLGAKVLLQFHQIAWVFFATPAYYILWQPESSGYAPQAKRLKVRSHVLLGFVGAIYYEFSQVVRPAFRGDGLQSVS